jgi:uncharacterized protein YutE (UPF0331/DUF86 family)
LRTESDVDVAFVPLDPAMTLADELALQAALEQAAGRSLDLVRLDRASTLLRWRVAREGVPLLTQAPYDWARFVAQAGIEHGDFAPSYARAAERLRQRIASGGAGRMTDAELVVQKLAVLHDHLARARRRRPATSDLLRADVDLQDSLSMSVLVAIQEAIDIAFHIVSDEGWGAPASYAESFDVLQRHGVIEAATARVLSGAVGLRNRVAHAYASLDIDRLWVELPAGLDALEQYAQAIARFVPPLLG